MVIKQDQEFYRKMKKQKNSLAFPITLGTDGFTFFRFSDSLIYFESSNEILRCSVYHNRDKYIKQMEIILQLPYLDW